LVIEQEGGKHLVAYYNTNGNLQALGESQLLQELSSHLPEYMVPSAVVKVDGFQLTVNGKLDIRALPDVDFSTQTDNVAPANATEKTLVELWSALLGMQQLGVTDHFFRMGGDSILAMRLSQQIARQFNVKVNVQLLFQYPTIRELAKQLDQQQNGDPTSSLVRISEGQPALSKLFLVPGAGATVASFYELADHLKGRYDVYGFNPDDSMPRNIKALARQYITALVELQETGPYTLGGFSFGANVIYEMAMQLTNQGRQINALYVFDGVPFFPKDLVNQTSGTFTDKILAATQVLYGQRLELMTEDLDRLPEKAQIRQLYRNLSVEKVLSTDEQSFTRQLSIYMQQVEMSQSYRPLYNQKLNCAVYLFRSMTNGLKIRDDYGWSEVTEQSVTIYKIDASHMEMLHSDSVKEIAEGIKKVGFKKL
ncbi:MAG: thioesterase domain-containing protein, partial [Bacteroidota bacterium]